MIKNALEATPAGGTVRLEVRPEDGAREIAVHNPGAMPREAQLQIFQRSFSTKGRGRGLGTYSMKLLSGYLDAELSFSSSEQEGTTFRLRLPTEAP
jgi:signal transduction histidine kinase